MCNAVFDGGMVMARGMHSHGPPKLSDPSSLTLKIVVVVVIDVVENVAENCSSSSYCCCCCCCWTCIVHIPFLNGVFLEILLF